MHHYLFTLRFRSVQAVLVALVAGGFLAPGSAFAQNTTTGSGATAGGAGNTASGTSAAAFGNGNTASQEDSVAFGFDNTASGAQPSGHVYSILGQASAFGVYNQATAKSSSAFGKENIAAGWTSSAFGYGNWALNEHSVAFGYRNDVDADSAIAFGKDNWSSGDGSITFGRWNSASAGNATAMGRGNSSTGINALALGIANVTSGDSAVSVGRENQTLTLRGMAFGIKNYVNGQHALVVGLENVASGSHAIGVGVDNDATGDRAVSIGMNNTASASYATAIGYGIVNNVANSLMVGPSDTAKLTILSTGNVGIGSANPTAKLDVTGDARISTNLTVGGALTATSLQVGGQSVTPASYLQSSGTYANPAWLTSLSAAKLTTGTLPASALPANSGDVTSPAGSTVLTLANTGVTAGTYSKVTVDTKGRVTAGAALTSADVTGALGYTPAVNSGSSLLTESGGKLGLSNTTPFYTFDVNGSVGNSQGSLSIFAGNTDQPKAGTVNIFSVDSGGGIQGEFRADASGVQISHESSGNYISVGSSGATISDESAGSYISVGSNNVVNSAGTLTLVSASDTALRTGGSFEVAKNPTTSYLKILNDGKVGIGTTTPAAKLDVTGDANISTNLTIGGALNAASLAVAGQSVVPANLVQTTGSYGNPAWITSLNASKLTSGTLPAAAMPAHTGDVTSSAGSTALTLANSGVAAGTYSKVTVDAKGRVTTGASLTSSDVTTALAGNVTGSASGLTLAAGGTNQNITVSPSGSGATVINGNVGIGRSAPSARLEIVDAGTSSFRVGITSNAANMTAQIKTSMAAIGADSGAQSISGAVAYDYYNAGSSSSWSGTLLTYHGPTATGTSYGIANADCGMLVFQNETAGVVATNNGSAIYIAPGAHATATFLSNGNVGIGTTSPDQKLAVNGTIHAKEVVVDTSSAAWSDYVFSPGYRLAPLSEVEQHIKGEGHLPGIPSAAEVADHGVNMGDMQAKLLAKIEELTLHQIAQEKQIAAQNARIEKLEAENALLSHR